ncbi:MAG: hypothetical protein IKE74_05235 [Mogibacterium sp.]|nr:hypothetical protein [Mogibacterium sp.]
MKLKLKGILVLTLCAAIMASCAVKQEPAPAPGPSPAPGGGTELSGDIPSDSILYFQDDEGAAKLMKDMEEGNIPSECRAMYDEMGARPEVLMTDPDQITEAYNRLSQMTIGGESDMGVTDSYHYIVFRLQDGTDVGWRFESAQYLVWGPQNYEVTSAGSIWTMVKELQDQMGAEE